MTFIESAPLAPGDTVAIIAPSGPGTRASMNRAVGFYEAWGLNVVVGEHALDKHPRASYLAGEDADRREDLVRTWCDPDIDAVVCARGGYGAMRLLDDIDWETMREAGVRRDGRPKLLTGSSDITALHEAFRLHLDVPTLFCPMPGTKVFRDSELVRPDVARWLFEPWGGRDIVGPRTEVIAEGKAAGVFTGGNLSLLAAGVGALESAENPAGILFLEDINEDVYRLDNLMLQLKRTGRLDSAEGLVLGSWYKCGDIDAVRDLMEEYLADLGVPVLWEQGFGHDPDALSIPLNVVGELDTTGDRPRLAVTGGAA